MSLQVKPAVFLMILSVTGKRNRTGGGGGSFVKQEN